jgi:hypothetical protein
MLVLPKHTRSKKLIKLVPLYAAQTGIVIIGVLAVLITFNTQLEYQAAIVPTEMRTVKPPYSPAAISRSVGFCISVIQSPILVAILFATAFGAVSKATKNVKQQ